MRTGIWLIGARGSVAVTALIGAAALRARLVDATGCVTELPPLRAAPLPAWSDLVFGGHDVVTLPLLKKAETLAAAGVVPGRLVTALADELGRTEQELRPLPSGDTQAETAGRIADDLRDFRDRHGLDRVVVLNVATTEPVVAEHPAHGSLDALRAALGEAGTVLPPSSLVAYAAFEAGCSFVDFTPSTGARLPALAELAARAGVPYAGNDGKTGETLVKSVLAPMFALRNLRVTSWSGLNLLGGGDGANLADPAANAAKVASKQRVLGDALGYQPEGTSRIDYVAEIGDFKTAWDLITFSGFLGTGMRMEFSWHGCDSALAAPLVLDLARLTAAAHRDGRRGALPELGFFFKDPLGDGPSALAAQWDALTGFAAGLTR
ncbi:myo-inositol-1-phosphate synthase [Actinoplanes sp. NBRC 14428]|uniref:Myo-inositol-1-phosphate synthase n=1 Tax=Pseudosporangium ferrugineum TaxID=439699 RepID=A0A2T0SHW0_9ACTN|nr:inositol-3-phosphate synthase [Pseudosporangium ferrugineum]PRY33004.1 myo-inositol-1-phosphate synthase [Pseudosporangium ferrugineum]BCJ49024.1 myo-inositol-1-phosphate synthase [Actinoplanes sp. NBRC 14428]